MTEPSLGLTLDAREGIKIISYVDASFGVHPDGKGQTGVVITLGGGANIYSESSKQKLVSKSSTETELIGLSDASSQVIWTRDFLEHQGYKMEASVIYQDNQSTMALVKNGRSNAKRTRHINIRFFFIKDRVDSGEISIRYMPTGDMIADVLMKPLQGELFRRLRDQLLNCSSID
jgi:hypothetical protein